MSRHPVRERAVAERAKCMADPEWVARYLAGGMVERELMSAIVVRMASEVRDSLPDPLNRRIATAGLGRAPAAWEVRGS